MIVSCMAAYLTFPYPRGITELLSLLLLIQVPPSLALSWSNQPPSPMLRLPPVNPYVPTDFSLRTPPGEGDSTTADERALADEMAAKLGLAVVMATPPILIAEQPGMHSSHMHISYLVDIDLVYKAWNRSLS